MVSGRPILFCIFAVEMKNFKFVHCNCLIGFDTIIRFHDYEDMLEETSHLEFPRRADMSDGLFLSGNGGLNMWENYPVFPTRPKEDNLGLAEAVTSSILLTGRIFCILSAFS